VPAKQLQIVPGGVNGAKEMVGTQVPPPFLASPLSGKNLHRICREDFCARPEC